MAVGHGSAQGGRGLARGAHHAERALERARLHAGLELPRALALLRLALLGGQPEALVVRELALRRLARRALGGRTLLPRLELADPRLQPAGLLLPARGGVLGRQRAFGQRGVELGEVRVLRLHGLHARDHVRDRLLAPVQPALVARADLLELLDEPLVRVLDAAQLAGQLDVDLGDLVLVPREERPERPLLHRLLLRLLLVLERLQPVALLRLDGGKVVRELGAHLAHVLRVGRLQADELAVEDFDAGDLHRRGSARVGAFRRVGSDGWRRASRQAAEEEARTCHAPRPWTAPRISVICSVVSSASSSSGGGGVGGGAGSIGICRITFWSMTWKTVSPRPLFNNLK